MNTLIHEKLKEKLLLTKEKLFRRLNNKRMSDRKCKHDKECEICKTFYHWLLKISKT